MKEVEDNLVTLFLLYCNLNLVEAVSGHDFADANFSVGVRDLGVSPKVHKLGTKSL